MTIGKWLLKNRRSFAALTAMQASLVNRPWPVSVLVRVELICTRARKALGAV